MTEETKRAILWNTVIRFPDENEKKAWDNYKKENWDVTSDCIGCRHCKDFICYSESIKLKNFPFMCRKNHRIYSEDIYDKSGKRLFPCECAADDFVDSIDYDVMSHVKIKNEFWNRYRIIVRLNR